MAEQTPASSEGLGMALWKTLVAAVAIVGLTSGAFWMLGQGGDDELIVADSPDEGGAGSDDDDGAEDDGADEPADGDQDTAADEPEPVDEGGEQDPGDAESPETDGDEPTESDEDEAAANEGANGEEEADGAATDDPGAEAETDAEPDTEQSDQDEAEEETAPAIDPAAVSVQVLDGYQADGGAAADQVAGSIESGGYNIIARNPALRSDVTEVLYNPGNETAADQLAAEIGAASVRPQPGNLSTSVDLHVVVGADRG